MTKRSQELYHKQQETKYTSMIEGGHFLIFICSHIAAAPTFVRTGQHARLLLEESPFFHERCRKCSTASDRNIERERH